MAADSLLLDFRDCRLLTAHFVLNREFEPGPDVQLSTNLTISHEYFGDERGNPCLRLFVKLLLHGDGAPLRAEIELGSVFTVSRKPADPVEAAKIAEINGAAIVFPYLRETVADLTRRSGLAPLHLPPVNFVELFRQNHPDTPAR